jgi:hypothetical protein
METPTAERVELQTILGIVSRKGGAKTPRKPTASGRSEFFLCHAEPFGDLRANSVKHLFSSDESKTGR